MTGMGFVPIPKMVCFYFCFVFTSSLLISLHARCTAVLWWRKKVCMQGMGFVPSKRFVFFTNSLHTHCIAAFWQRNKIITAICKMLRCGSRLWRRWVSCPSRTVCFYFVTYSFNNSSPWFCARVESYALYSHIIDKSSRRPFLCLESS